MPKLLADVVAKAFNDTAPSHWRARAYLKNRAATGVFNACKFTYKGGMIQLLMDCDAPVGQGFHVKFVSYTASFGDYLVSIQKALYQVLSRLRDAEMADGIPEMLSPTDIMFGLRKDGAVTFLVVYSMRGGDMLAGPEGMNELSYERDSDADALDTSVDDLL